MTNLVTNGQPQNDVRANLLRATFFLCVVADKEDNRDRDQARGSQMTTGRFAESNFSQTVDLLERSVSLLKESPLERNVSSPLEKHQGQRALANYR